MKNPSKLERFIHTNIICKIVKDPAIQAMGIVSGIRYNLGIAKPGRDYIDVQ